MAHRQGCGAGRRAQECDLIRLAGDFDRHSDAPCVDFTIFGPKPVQRATGRWRAASSAGSVKRTSSRIRSKSRWFVNPNFESRWLTCSTRISGAEAPAVNPSELNPASQDSLISFASSISRDATPARLATSTRRLEFELF